jgi:anti-anti-sigma regulatory factor
MNSNIFERKTFMDSNYISANDAKIFSKELLNNYIVLKVNLLRATANESDLLKSYLSKLSLPVKNSIIFDLSSCSFVDSSFLSCIISFNNEKSVKIKLVVSDARQLAIFKITKLDSLFNIYTSLENALAA